MGVRLGAEPSREQSRLERNRREMRAVLLTVVRMLGYAVLVCLGVFVCGFVAFLVLS